MAIARIQASTVAGATTAAPSASWPAATTAGNLLIATLGWSGLGVTATAPSGWTQAVTVANGASQVAIYFIANAASRSGSEAFSLSSSVRCLVAVAEYSGVATSAPLDQVASTTASVASGTTAATTQADELCVTILASAGSGAQSFSAPTNSFVIVGQASTGGAQQFGTAWHERIVTATGAYGHSDTATGGSTPAGVIATFKAAAGGGGGGAGAAKSVFRSPAFASSIIRGVA